MALFTFINFLKNRIKKIMQTNKDIGKIQNNTPLFLAKALEVFLEDLIGLSAGVA